MSSQNFLRYHNDIVRQSRDFYEKCTSFVMDNEEDDALKKEYLSAFRGYVEQSVKTEYMNSNAQVIIQNMKDKVNNNEGDFNEEHWYGDFKKLVSEFQKEDKNRQLVENDSQIQNIQRLIDEIDDPSPAATSSEMAEDADVEASEGSLNLIDPISKKMMSDPVRHKPCGHVYDRVSIMGMIKQGRRKGARCPYMGCAYRQPIDPQNFEDASDYKQEIRRRMKEGTYGD